MLFPLFTFDGSFGSHPRIRERLGIVSHIPDVLKVAACIPGLHLMCGSALAAVGRGGQDVLMHAFFASGNLDKELLAAQLRMQMRGILAIAFGPALLIADIAATVFRRALNLFHIKYA